MLALALFVAAGAPNAWALLVPARRVTTRGSNRILSEASFEQFKLVAADGRDDDYFGKSVAIDGNTVVVGADQPRYWDGSSYVDAGPGAAYVLRASDGEELAKLTASDAAAGDNFGQSVAISGGTIVVGATGASTGGAVYVFRTTDGGATYGQVAKLTASDAAAVDFFGYSVAIDGNTIVVGANGDDDGGSTSGSAYVFRTSDGGATYVEVAKLTASDGAEWDYFGGSVAIDGDTVVVGSVWDDDGGSSSGSAYVFRTSDGWATHTEIKLTAADAAASDSFGYSVAIDGGTIVVGAYGDDDDGSASGSAYVFLTSDGGATYDQVAKLTAADAASYDYFGYSVAIDGAKIVIGAYGDDDAGSSSGSAYIFHTSDGGATYGQVAKLTAADAAEGDYFGKSVAIDGHTIVVGAYHDDDSSGSAYLFSDAGSEGLDAGSDSAQTLGSDAATRTGPLLALLVAAGLAL